MSGRPHRGRGGPPPTPPPAVTPAGLLGYEMLLSTTHARPRTPPAVRGSSLAYGEAHGRPRSTACDDSPPDSLVGVLRRPGGGRPESPAVVSRAVDPAVERLRPRSAGRPPTARLHPDPVLDRRYGQRQWRRCIGHRVIPSAGRAATGELHPRLSFCSPLQRHASCCPSQAAGRALRQPMGEDPAPWTHLSEMPAPDALGASDRPAAAADVGADTVTATAPVRGTGVLFERRRSCTSSQTPAHRRSRHSRHTLVEGQHGPALRPAAGRSWLRRGSSFMRRSHQPARPSTRLRCFGSACFTKWTRPPWLRVTVTVR
jgi:hypothetical protein